jgi:isoquinoline 1-oxidoreductase subunit beta
MKFPKLKRSSVSNDTTLPVDADAQSGVSAAAMRVANDEFKISRRGLLIGSSATGALLVGTYLARGALVRQFAGSFLDAEAFPQSSPGVSRHDMWFEVPHEGRVILYMPKAEMGQGIHTALAQIAVEDLELTMQQLEVRPVTLVSGGNSTSSRGFGGIMSTAGSRSIVENYAGIRASANTLKEMLLLEGAVQLGVARAQVEALDGMVRVVNEPTKTVPYGTIVKNRTGALGTWSAPAKVPPLKPRSKFKVIGTSATRIDAAQKVVGNATYGFDAKVDGLCFGAVARPPRYNATLTKADANDAESAPGVLKVVVDIDDDFVGVVATTRKRAYDALAKITCTWEGGSDADDASIMKALSTKRHGFDLVAQGNASNTLSKLPDSAVIEREYYVPAAAHAHLEPLAAMAHVEAEEVHVWVATQQPESVASDVGGALKKGRSVIVHPTYLGGGFGRKFVSHMATEAVRLSEASGKPVQVALSREEDMALGPFRPPTFARMRGAVANGRVLGIDQHTVSGAGDQAIQATLQVVGLDIAEAPGLVSPYRNVDGYRVNSASVDVDVPTGIWRGVGLLPNSFVNESFMDELAHEAKVDPLEFRLTHLKSDRIGSNYARLLKEVAKRSDWGSPLGDGQGRGIAAAAMAGTIVAAAVEVGVAGNDITIKQVWVCADPGLVINPAGAALQISGGVMMSLSSAFGEQMRFEKGMAVSTNLDSYYLLRADKAPPVDVHLMGSGDVPAGLGEPGIGPVCAALANAVFAATGKRLRSLPLQLS